MDMQDFAKKVSLPYNSQDLDRLDELIAELVMATQANIEDDHTKICFFPTPRDIEDAAYYLFNHDYFRQVTERYINNLPDYSICYPAIFDALKELKLDEWEQDMVSSEEEKWHASREINHIAHGLLANIFAFGRCLPRQIEAKDNSSSAIAGYNSEDACHS